MLFFFFDSDVSKYHHLTDVRQIGGWLLRGTGREETREEGRKAGRKVLKLVILACESCRIVFSSYKYSQELTVIKNDGVYLWLFQSMTS